MGQRSKILVVDDDGDARECVRAALAHAGFAVDTARDGLEALTRLAATPADLVLTDYQMPGMSGLDLICGLRARGHATPVVLLTGADTRDMCTAARAYGADACLSKPVNLDDLIWTIECALACHAPLATAATLRPAVRPQARW